MTLTLPKQRQHLIAIIIAALASAILAVAILSSKDDQHNASGGAPSTEALSKATHLPVPGHAGQIAGAVKSSSPPAESEGLPGNASLHPPSPVIQTPSTTIACSTGDSGENASERQDAAATAKAPEGNSFPHGGRPEMRGAVINRAGGPGRESPSSLVVPDKAGGSNANEGSSLPVPVGAKAPVAFYDTEPKPPQQQAVLNLILNDFKTDVESSTSQGMTVKEAWEYARMRADERYKILYGWQAYNTMHLRSAIEALEEKKRAEADAAKEQTTSFR